MSNWIPSVGSYIIVKEQSCWHRLIHGERPYSGRLGQIVKMVSTSRLADGHRIAEGYDGIAVTFPDRMCLRYRRRELRPAPWVNQSHWTAARENAMNKNKETTPMPQLDANSAQTIESTLAQLDALNKQASAMMDEVYQLQRAVDEAKKAAIVAAIASMPDGVYLARTRDILATLAADRTSQERYRESTGLDLWRLSESFDHFLRRWYELHAGGAK